jgi:hypothetical protein
MFLPEHYGYKTESSSLHFPFFSRYSVIASFTISFKDISFSMASSRMRVCNLRHSAYGPILHLHRDNQAVLPL